MVTACYSTGQILLVLIVVIMVSVLIGVLWFIGQAMKAEELRLRADER